MNRYYIFGGTILLGLIVALYLGWGGTVSATNAAPELLREDFRADYTLMVAEAYSADEDVERAISALSFLSTEGEPYNPVDFVGEALAFGTENGYTVTDLTLLQTLEGALIEFDPAFAATPTP
jgi:hypothetical protein